MIYWIQKPNMDIKNNLCGKDATKLPKLKGFPVRSCSAVNIRVEATRKLNRWRNFSSRRAESVISYAIYPPWCKESVVCPNHSFPWPLTPVQAQKSDPLKSRQQVDLERAHFLVTQAFEEDEKGNDDEAIELYTQAVELCIKTVGLSLSLSLFVITLSDTATFAQSSLTLSTFVSSSVFATVQRHIGPGAADQAEAAGTSGFRQVSVPESLDSYLVVVVNVHRTRLCCIPAVTWLRHVSSTVSVLTGSISELARVQAPCPWASRFCVLLFSFL